jgi:ISXO2 transposase-like protein
VNHTANEWVRGDVHTNNIEGMWNLLKRSLIGSYHHLSVKHMDSYLGEIAWRFNNRPTTSCSAAPCGRVPHRDHDVQATHGATGLTSRRLLCEPRGDRVHVLAEGLYGVGLGLLNRAVHLKEADTNTRADDREQH